ncbi:MAG: YaaA family protein, partial [Neisseriaceae bacterium]|nr:YaaA family protein [Neisseriaceae bacterium]
MIFILSPAKKMNESESNQTNFHAPTFQNQAQELLEVLGTYSPQEIASLMKISDKLAWQNKQRYQDILSGSAQMYPAIELFAGDVYRGLDYSSLSGVEKQYVQNHLLILSGLYGVLKPGDTIPPYRLEMGTPLSIEGAKNLYQFWDGLLDAYITQELQNDSQQEGKCLINLASQEYAKVLDFKKIPYPVITPVFKRM